MDIYMPESLITGHPSCLTACRICYSPDPAILLSATVLHLPFFFVNIFYPYKPSSYQAAKKQE